MLNIQKITFYNYLPYYKEKVFDLGGKEGVTLIFGDNNIGKTSFIRGIKFLFYNILHKNPDNPNFNIHYNINRKAFQENIYEFYVQMEFTYKEEKYFFARKYNKKSEVVGVPKSDDDFEHIEIIGKGNELFSEAKRKELISKIIPKNISEFVFFDGENIKKYIEILNDDSDSGAENRRVKQAINNVIGTPYLDNLILHMEVIRNHYKSEYSKKLVQSSKDNDLKEKILKYTKELSIKEEDRREIDAELKKTNSKFEEINRTLENLSRPISINDELIEVKTKLKNEENELINAEKHLKNLVNASYKSLLYDKLNNEKNKIELSLVELSKKNSEFEEKTKEINRLKELLESQTCSLCGSHVTSNLEKDIISKIDLLEKEKESNKFSPDEKKIFNSLKRKLDKINLLLDGITLSTKEEIINTLQKITKHRYSISGFKKTISKLEDELKNYHNLSKLIKDRDKLQGIIEKYKNTLTILDSEIKDLDNKIKTYSKKIRGVTDVEEIEKKVLFVEKVIEKYSYIKTRFIEEMRLKVQKHANEIFMSFVKGLNDDIDRIEINENYRMSIYTKENIKIPVPGNGYNNLLALSLIYGLNKNTHLFGTIFFDAALSNLSNNYTNNIIKTLSLYAPQLIFLAHKDRVDFNEARKVLQNKIVNEFEIYQDGDSFNTKIRRL